jgi:hypothetical protein
MSSASTSSSSEARVGELLAGGHRFVTVHRDVNVCQRLPRAGSDQCQPNGPSTKSTIDCTVLRSAAARSSTMLATTSLGASDTHV